VTDRRTDEPCCTESGSGPCPVHEPGATLAWKERVPDIRRFSLIGQEDWRKRYVEAMQILGEVAQILHQSLNHRVAFTDTWRDCPSSMCIAVRMKAMAILPDNPEDVPELLH
jgi:hypothetical protein